MPRAVSPSATKSRKAKASVRTVALRQTALDTSNMDGCREVDPSKPLTDKQKEFVKFLAMGESPPNAQQLAGMSMTNAHYCYRLMAMPNIQLALKQEQEALRAHTLMTREKVVNMHLEAFEMAKLLAEPASMVAAAREIGKIHGFYEPKKIDITVNGATAKKFEQMSTQELEEIVQLAQKAEQANNATKEIGHGGSEEDDGA